MKRRIKLACLSQFLRSENVKLRITIKEMDRCELLREDTHKKSVFFSGRTPKGVERFNPPTTKQETLGMDH